MSAPADDDRTLHRLLASADGALAHGEWAAFRSHLAALRDRLLSSFASEEAEHQRMREIVEALAAVSPAHDPQGCRSELAELAGLVRAHAGSRRAAPVLPLLDLRGLQPPQPIVQILDALDREPQTPLRVVLPHEPHPLYDLLRGRGFEWSGAPRADGGFELTIRRARA